jgi:hypothetical protein
MTEPIPREDVIELLNRLGSDRDEDVLEAAREVHARITAGNMTWDQLLVPDHADDADDADDESNDDEIDDESDDDESDDDESDDSDDSDDSDAIESSDSDEEATEPAGAAGAKNAKNAKNAESLALIDKLLAMRGISTDLREELKGYKTDIAEGEFETRDHRYLRAVHARLSKRR